MKTKPIEVVSLPVDEIRVFVSRARPREGFERLKASIKSVGLKMPIGVRRLVRATDGKKYELNFGEGRLLAHQQLGLRTIPAIVTESSEAEIVGLFLAENIIRKPLPWYEKALLVKADLDAGMSSEEVADRYFVTAPHVEKYRRLISKTAAGLEKTIARLPMNEAEILTALPAKHQTIVIGTIREMNEPPELKAIIRQAKEISESGRELSITALKQSLERADEDLRRVRAALKLLRLHHSLGPANLAVLLKEPKFRKTIKQIGISTQRFEAVSSEA